MAVATAEIVQDAYYSDGFTLYYIVKLSPQGKVVSIENCFTGEVKTRDTRELQGLGLERVHPAASVPLSRHLRD